MQVTLIKKNYVFITLSEHNIGEQNEIIKMQSSVRRSSNYGKKGEEVIKSLYTFTLAPPGCL